MYEALRHKAQLADIAAPPRLFGVLGLCVVFRCAVPTRLLYDDVQLIAGAQRKVYCCLKVAWSLNPHLCTAV